ncbi:oxygenase MpaB family protein [Actinoplanes sp. NPDC049548]|uniref:oxygenase MpaB family protein n=1 Tax=Actinoplanes sp. NPDC049548 TaxID=3155152 RepID=UPI003429AF2B
MLHRRGRYDRLADIRRRDPVADYHTVYRDTALYEFPFDTRMGLVLAFWRTFAVPSIAETLAGTGEVVHRTDRRADDTGILMYTLIKYGLDHPHGRTATRRLNQIHRRFAISNDDYRYVLGTFLFAPARWIDRHGWRPLCCHERAAMLTFYTTLGRRMNIRDIPRTWDAFQSFYDTYEAQRFAYTPAAAQLMAATGRLVGSLPRPLAPLAGGVVQALLDPPLRHATGIAEPPGWAAVLLAAALKGRAAWLRHGAKPRTRGWLEEGITGKTYPDGYDLATLGPQ